MENIEIREFATAQVLNDIDYVVLSLSDGSAAKVLVHLMRQTIAKSITPSIQDGVWWVGSVNQGVEATGKTAEFRKGVLGIEYKYTSEDDSSWRLLVPFEDIKLKFSDLTDEQREEISLTFADLTEEEIAELQQPANDMIAILTSTNNTVTEAESKRVTAENNRVAAENKRVTAENNRVVAENARVSAETERENEFNTLKNEVNEAVDSVEKAIELTRNVPTIQNGTWWIYDVSKGAYIDSGTNAVGKSPQIVDGNWWLWNEKTGVYEDSGVSTGTGYELKVASATELGGIKAASRTEEYTEEVMVDAETGKAYVKPSTQIALATEDAIGGIKASAKTEAETVEVKIDSETGKLFVPAVEGLQMASEEVLGGVKASVKTETETVEVKIDPETGKLYVPAQEELVMATADTLGGVKASEIDETYTEEVRIDSSTGKLYVPASGGVSADEEDLTIEEGVMMLKDKSYSSSDYSGMGRVYLRKNMVSGVNRLTQSMIPKANTNVRYIIQYDYDLNGASITIPSGCVLDFQGGSLNNGSVVFTGTLLTGLVKVFCRFSGVCINDKFNVKEFGAKGDGSTDDTSVIRSVIKLAYTSSLNSSSWRMCRSIYFPAGIYKVTDSLIDSSLSVGAGRFAIEGDAWHNTTISLTGDTLFDNTGVFGFTYFSGLTFSGNNQNLFMNLQGGGTGNAQSIEFYRCRFASWHTVLDITGDTMCSEMTFYSCKIAGCGSESNPCRIFSFNNSQSVNFRLFSTDIESYIGTCYYFLRGTTIYHYQGSNIAIGTSNAKSAIMEVPSGANSNYFGGGNYPNYAAFGVRYELRGYVYLLKKSEYTDFIACHDSCNMGGLNLTTDNGFYTIDALGSFELDFKQCYNYTSFKARHGYNGSVSQAALINADNGLFTQLKSNSISYLATGAQSNSIQTLSLINTVTGERFPVGASGEYVNVGTLSSSSNNVSSIKERVFYFGGWETDLIALIAANADTIEMTKNYKGLITKISLYNIASSAYGNTRYTMNVYHKTDNGKGEFITTVAGVYMKDSSKNELDLNGVVKVNGLVFEFIIDWTFTVPVLIKGIVTVSGT